MVANFLSGLCVLISCHANASADRGRRTAQVLDFSLGTAQRQDQSGLLSSPVQTRGVSLTAGEQEPDYIAADQALTLTALDRAVSSHIGLRLRGDFAGALNADPDAFQLRSSDARGRTGCACEQR